MEWRDVLVMVVMGLVALFGAPITQLIKNGLGMLLKRTIEERWALALSMVVAVGLALLEMYLNGQLATAVITTNTFPTFLAGVIAIAQTYYQLFKKSDSVVGTQALLKKVMPS